MSNSSWIEQETRLLKETWSLALLLVKQIGAIRGHAFGNRVAANLMDQTNPSA